MSYIDLHTHSKASDGEFSPAKVIALAKQKGLAAIALTDHDTMAGLEEAEKAAGSDLEFIRGCEVSVTTPLGSMHILGLWLPHDSSPLEKFLESQRERRRVRNEKIIKILNSMGMDITLDEVEAKADSAIGRPHFAAVLLEKGYVRDIPEAFAKYIGDDGPAYVKKPYQDPKEAIRIMHDLGATVAIAHPLLENPPVADLEAMIADWKTAGLDALEAWHSRHDAKKTAIVIDLARKYDLGLTGGSDFHGKSKKDINLGTGAGNLRIPYEVLDNLKKRRKEAGLPC